MIETVKPRRSDGAGVGVIAIEGVVFLMQFLKLMPGQQLGESGVSSFRVVVVVSRAINRVFGEVEITRDDSVGREVEVDNRVNFSKPNVTVRAMKVEINNTEGFTCRAAGEGSHNGRAFVNNGGVIVNDEGSCRRASRLTSGNSRVDQRDDTTSRRVGRREVNRVGGEDVSKGGKVVVGGGTNVLDTNNIIPIQKRLEVRDDFEVTGDQTTRETEATGVDIGGDNGGELEMGCGVPSLRIGGGGLEVSVLTGVDLHGGRN
jgi:hypothetical protein